MECNGLFLESTQLRYQTQFFRPSQWDSLLAVAVSFMPVLASNIGYANCTVNRVSLVDLRCTSGCRCEVQRSTIPQWHVSCGVRTNAQLPAVDLKSTFLDHSGKLTCASNMYVGSYNTCVDLWMDVAGVPGFLTTASWLVTWDQ